MASFGQKGPYTGDSPQRQSKLSVSHSADLRILNQPAEPSCLNPIREPTPHLSLSSASAGKCSETVMYAVQSNKTVVFSQYILK